MLRRKQHTAELAKAPSFVAPSDGDVLPPALSVLRPTEPRPHVVAANNAPAPLYAWAIMAGVAMFFPAIFAIVILLLGAPKYASLLAWTAGVIIIGVFSLPAISGDLPSLSEIRQSHRTERKRINEMSRAVDRHFDLEAMKESNRHDEAMASIAASTDTDYLHQMILGIQATVARLADAHDVPATIAQPQTYVAATPSEAVSAAKRWVATMMASSTDGNAPPIAKVAMPWNGEWKAKAWAPDARQWLLDNVLEQHGTVYRWRDEFATVASAQDALRRM